MAFDSIEETGRSDADTDQFSDNGGRLADCHQSCH